MHQALLDQLKMLRNLFILVKTDLAQAGWLRLLKVCDLARFIKNKENGIISNTISQHMNNREITYGT